MAVFFLIEPSREDIASAQRGCLNTLDIIEKMMLYGRAVDIQGKAGEGCTVYFLFPKALQIVEKIGKME